MRVRNILKFSVLLLLGLAGCQRALQHQPKLKVYQDSPFFKDGASARNQVEGTVAQSDIDIDSDDDLTGVPVTLAVMSRGRERYEIYCSVCHGLTGTGDGLAIKRGFQKPESLQSEKLRAKSVASYVKTMAVGDGAMQSFSDRLDRDDQVAIGYYIKALQLSQNFKFDDLTNDEKRRLGAQP